MSTTNQLNYRYTTRLRADESRPWENNMKFFDFLRKIPDFLTIFYVFLYFCDVANFEHRHRFLRTHHTMRRIFGLHPTGSSTNIGLFRKIKTRILPGVKSANWYPRSKCLLVPGTKLRSANCYMGSPPKLVFYKILERKYYLVSSRIWYQGSN